MATSHLKSPSFMTLVLQALYWTSALSTPTVIRKQPKALSKGTWTYEDPVGTSQFGQYIYSSPMNKTCLHNLTIHVSSWICGVYIAGTPYFEEKTCIPDSYDMVATVVDKVNLQGNFLKSTCIQLSAYHIEYYKSPIQQFTSEIIDAAVRHPIKHGLSIATHWAQATAFAKGASLVGRPLMQTYFYAFGFISDFEPVETMFRLQSDSAWTMDGTLDMLPQRFAVLYDADSASEAGVPIRAAVARKNKTIGLSFIIPAYTPADPTRTDEPHNQFIDELLATGLRYVLLVTNPELTHAVLACKLYKRGLHKYIQVFTLLGMPFYGAWDAFADQECTADTGVIVTEQGGWWGLTYALPGVEDDAVINTYSGATGMPDGQSYGLDGEPWQDNSLVVQATADCHDDEDGLSRAGLQGVLNKSVDENITCREIMHFGQTRRQAYLQDIAKYCPISSCAYNRMMPACRTSCACSDSSLSTSWGTSLCVTIKDLVLDYADDGSTSKDYRCEGKNCRPLAYAPSTVDFTAQFTKFSDWSAATGSPNASIGGWCPPPFAPCNIIGYWAVYNLLMPGIADGVWAQAMGFKCIEEKFGADGLERLARFDYGDRWVTEKLISCLEMVEFEGSVGRISFKEEDGHSSTPGYTPMLITEGQWSSFRLYSTSGYLKPGGMVHSTHVIRREDQSQCEPWASTFGPGMTCPEGTEIEYTLKEQNFEVIPFGEPAKCPPGQYPLTINESASFELTDHCQPCAPGSFKDTTGSERCLPCPPGWSIDSYGASKCAPCPLDTFSAEPRQTLELYGGVQQHFGSSSCGACPAGTVQPQATGSKTCVCAKGFYGSAVAQGAPDCIPCNGGMTTATIGATNDGLCFCPTGTYISKDRSHCIPCEVAFDCKGGNEPPTVREGYFADIRANLPEEAFVGVDGEYSVFECYTNKLHCPAGPVGACAEGREGLGCASCKPGTVDAGDGTCMECEPGNLVPFVSACILAAIIAVIAYHFVSKADRAKSTHSLLFLGLMCGMLVSNFQHLAATSTINVTFLEPVKSLMNTFSVLTFDLDVLQVGCAASLDPLSSYLSNICTLLVCLTVMALIHALFVLIMHKGRFMQEMPTLVGTLGVVMMAFFIAICNSAIAPYQCVKHPNGLSTVLRYPTVICGESETHSAMVGFGVPGLLVPISFVVGCCVAVYKFPQKMQQGNTQYLKAFAFLFSRFNPESYWYTLFVVCRNLVIALAPTVPSNLAQVLIISGSFVASLTITARFLPWRTEKANYVDCCITMIMIMFLVAAGFLVSEIEDTLVSIAMAVIIIGNFIFMLVVMASGVYVHLLHRGLKPFAHLICHHKGGSGAAARFTKIELQENIGKQKKVFIDSDELQNLDMLFDYVGSQTDNVVALLSKEIYLRPWCVGELVTAHLKEVSMSSVIFPEFMRPSDEFINTYDQQVDTSCLTPYGISSKMVQAMITWHRDLPGARMPDVFSLATFQELAGFLAKGESAGKVLSRSPALSNDAMVSLNTTTAAVADHSNVESVAAALVLCKLLSRHFSDDISRVPRLLQAGELIPEKTKVCMFVLSNGCFLNAGFIHAMSKASTLRCNYLPVISEDGFRFPSASMLETFKSAWVQQNTIEDPMSLAALPTLIQSLFKETVVDFTPQEYSSAEELLDAKAAIVAGRLVGDLQVLQVAADPSPPEIVADRKPHTTPVSAKATEKEGNADVGKRDVEVDKEEYNIEECV